MADQAPRARGNALFTAKDFAGAAAAYAEGLSISGSAAGTSEERAVLLSNRAACHLALDDPFNAVVDCRASLALQPCSFKTHYRLAKALPRDDADAAAAVCAALALQLPAHPGADILALYEEVRVATDAATAAAAAAAAGPGGAARRPLLQLPEDPLRRVSCAATAGAAASALTRGGVLVVLRPGRYEMMQLQLMTKVERYVLIGLGDVHLASTMTSHAVWVQGHTTAALYNVRLSGNGSGAAVCVSAQLVGDAAGAGGGAGGRLQLVGCRVEDYGEAGLLVAGGWAELHRCAFSRCARHAVEVREGGTLLASHVTIDRCLQGVSAYGGARRVVLQHCVITRATKEGVLIAGTFENAASALQAAALKAVGPAPQRTVGSAATQAAEKWGKERAVGLEVTLLHCTIAGCANFGVSADSGARVALHQCRLEGNDPFAVFVKGNTDASVTACQVLYSGMATKKSLWASALGMKMAQSGVQVAANYGGSVEVHSCAFAGPAEFGVVEEMVGGRWALEGKKLPAQFGSNQQQQMAAKQFGMWSKPVSSSDNLQFTLAEGGGMPSVQALAQRLPGHWRDGSDASSAAALGLGPQRRAAAAAAPAAALRRTCRTFQQAAWAPTASEYYAIGNTVGYDVTAGQLPAGGACPRQGPRAVRVLLAACGDIRNLAATVHAVAGAAAAAGSGGGAPRMTCVLNDGNLSMLARDAVLLHMAAEGGAEAEDVLAVWANHGLTASQAALLHDSLQTLADGLWPVWLSAAHSLDGDTPAAAQDALRRVMRAWANCAMTLPQLLAQRAAVLAAPLHHLRAVALSIDALRAGDPAAESSYSVEVKEYITSGSLRTGSRKAAAPLTAPNPTFLLAPQLQYTVYFSSSIFRAVALAAKVAGTAGAPAYQRLLTAVAPQLDTVAEALRSGALTCSLVPGDILTAMTSSITCVPFDYIDCSNCADYVSLPALLQAATPLLSRAPHARLHLESIVAYNTQRAEDPTLTPHRFVEACLRLSLPTYEALLGLHFVGGQALPDTQKTLRMEWASAAAAAASATMAATRPSSASTAAAASGAAASGAGGAAAAAATAGQSWLSTGYLLLELLAASKHYLINHAVPSGGDRHLCDWAATASPLTLVHLVSLAAPQQADALLRALIRCDATQQASLFKWELSMHAAIQSGRSCPLLRLTLNAQPGFALLHTYHEPLLVAFSTKPLRQGHPAAPLTQVRQLLTSFLWDEEMAVATLLLPESIMQLCGKWHATLCVLRDSAGLVAVGVSVALAAMPAAPAVAPSWRPLCAPCRLDLDMAMVEQVGAPAPAEGAAAPWRGVVRDAGDGSGGVTVDVVAPGPLPPSEEAVVSASVSGGALVVTVTPKRGTGGGGGGGREATAAAASSFSVALPEGVAGGTARDIKMSRKLGILSARVDAPHVSG